MLRILLILTALCAVCDVTWVQGGPVVRTRNGLLRGLEQQDRHNRTYEVFKGVRYSETPARWQYAPPLGNWEGIRYPANVSEDCLHLTVYAPGTSADRANRSLPVMFYFYGGAYLFGTGAMYPGQQLALEGDVIVVVVNSRISVLGFLSTGDDVAPGNYALFDGLEALRWTRRNIRAFGGDPDRVTLFGQSAGGGMTMLTALSPLTRGLFHRAISISGTGDRLHTANQTASVLALGRYFNCSTDSNQIIIDCLKRIDAEDLEEGAVLGLISQGHIPNWQPIRDGNFLPGSPRELLRQGALANVSLMTGNTHHDSATFVLGNLLGWPSNTSDAGNGCGTLNGTEDMVDMFDQRYHEDLSADLYRLYPALRDPDLETRTRACVHMWTDENFGGPSYLDASLHTGNSAAAVGTYRYVFQYRPSFLAWPSWVNGSHLDDIYFVFGQPFLEVWSRDIMGGEWSALDLRKHREHVAYFTNFAHTGNPSRGPHAVSPAWQEYDVTGRRIMHLTHHNNVRQESDERLQRYRFWNSKTRRLDAPIGGVNKLTAVPRSVEQAFEYLV